MSATRHEDGELVIGDNPMAARRFNDEMTSPAGKFSSETWPDERGVPLRSTTTMPFGTNRFELSPESVE